MRKQATGIRRSQRAMPQMVAASARRILNARPDLPDIRDRMYEPALLDLDVVVPPPTEADSPVLDQGQEGACTGFALAAALNFLRRKRDRRIGRTDAPSDVSARMLFEMARLHDEWPGENYDWSSLRGVIKGFFHNGVCADGLAPWTPGEMHWSLSVEQAKDARSTSLGAYFRLRPEIVDYHAALNEAGVIVASARIHDGWSAPKNGVIAMSSRQRGGHAFAIVGYDASGFLIQNSWGREWGGFGARAGVSHWSYADWAANIVDAWVLRLGVPTPDAFDLTHASANRSLAGPASNAVAAEPRRQDVAGHVVHLDDGKLVETGRYASPISSLRETGRWIFEDENRPAPKYDHLLFYAHGGLNTAADCARMIAATKEGFKRNRIYPVFFMWETALFENLRDVLGGIFSRGAERIGGPSDFSDSVFEALARPIGRAIWREIKADAQRAFRGNAGGAAAIEAIAGANLKRRAPLKTHLAGHSAGGVFLGEMLRGWSIAPIATAALMAPACTVDYYKRVLLPALGGARPVLGKIEQFSLTETREQDDTVTPLYGKSLLYLISRALEERGDEPLLGMERYAASAPRPASHVIRLAGRDRKFTDSPDHGGFDNDAATMNSILALITGSPPKPGLAFKPDELDFG